MGNEFDFWQAAPGLFSAGADIYSRLQNRKEANARLGTERPDIYNQFADASKGQLALAGNADPRAFAADRFAQQQALLKPLQDKQLDELMSTLRAKGQLGISTYQGAGTDPISKTPQTWQQTAGVAVNPQLAAFYAAQAGQTAKSAYDSQAQGDAYLDGILKRAGMLNQNAQNAQPAAPVQNAALRSKFGMLPGLITSAADFANKNPALMQNVWNGGKKLLNQTGLFDFGGGNSGSWLTAGNSTYDPYNYGNADSYQPNFDAGYYG